MHTRPTAHIEPHRVNPVTEKKKIYVKHNLYQTQLVNRHTSEKFVCIYIWFSLIALNFFNEDHKHIPALSAKEGA